MKLLNIFKKETKKVVKSNLQKLEKKQLEKLIGGATVSNTDVVEHRDNDDRVTKK